MSRIQTWTSLRYRILSSFVSRSPAISSYLIKAVLKTRLGARDHLHESLSWIVQSCPTIKIQDRCSRASANPGKAWSVRAKLALDHFLSSVCLFVALRHKSLHRSIANLGVYIQLCRFNLYQLPIEQWLLNPLHSKHCLLNFSIPLASSHFKGAWTEAPSGQYHQTKMPPIPEALDVIFEERINAAALETSPREKGSAAVLQDFPADCTLEPLFFSGHWSRLSNVQYLLRLAIFGSRSRVYLPAPAHCLVAGPRWL